MVPAPQTAATSAEIEIIDIDGDSGVDEDVVEYSNSMNLTIHYSRGRKRKAAENANSAAHSPPPPPPPPDDVIDLSCAPETPAYRRNPHLPWRKAQSVHWAIPLEQHYEELEDSDDEGGDQRQPQNQPTSSATSCTVGLTEEMTLISTEHGRKRRDQRNISKYDFKAAIRHGVKTRSHPCPRTGQGRWKYTWGNLVCITDETSKVEITSYKEKVDLMYIPETPQLCQQHKDAVEALREEPQLICSHTIVVIDQSGSMKEHDVNGYPSRSAAAYGVLAQDFIGEQVYTTGDDNAIDVVSLIEMNDEGNLIYDRVPLDWKLYNNLLYRQKRAHPRSHGNYDKALERAKQVIDADLQALSNPSQSEMPNYVLVFLSDGRPSDMKHPPGCRPRRELVLEDIAYKLGSKLSFVTIGLGGNHLDFVQLRRLVDVARQHGASGSFDYAHLSAESLGSTMTRLSTTLTMTRTATLSAPGMFEAEDCSDDEDIILRSKKTGRDYRKYSSFLEGVSCKTYSREGDCYVAQKFRNPTAVGFKIETRPFSEGRERLAYTFYEVGPGGFQVGKELIAKRSRQHQRNSQASRFNKRTCRIHSKASQLAKVFNDKVVKSPHLHIEFGSAPRVEFLECSVYDFKVGRESYNILVEDKLQGRFTKYNSNNGYVLEDSGSTVTTIDGAEIYLTEFLQAFSHWTYAETDHDLLVCDLQGVLNEEGMSPIFQLTDPVICSRSTQRYGKTDVGKRGFQSFRLKHRCNQVCRRIGLPSFGARVSSNLPRLIGERGDNLRGNSEHVEISRINSNYDNKATEMTSTAKQPQPNGSREARV